MSIRLKILETNKQLENTINQVLSKRITDNLSQQENSIKKQLSLYIPDWINKRKEVVSLKNEGRFGELNSELGLYPGQADNAVLDIIDILIRSITVKSNILSSRPEGTIEFGVSSSYLNNVLSIDRAFVVSEKYVLPWLKWLLTMGTSTIIYGYQYKPTDYGRSDGGIMIKGNSWRIDPVYAGTTEDNFITRAFRRRESTIQAVVKKAFKDMFK